MNFKEANYTKYNKLNEIMCLFTVCKIFFSIYYENFANVKLFHVFNLKKQNKP